MEVGETSEEKGLKCEGSRGEVVGEILVGYVRGVGET